MRVATILWAGVHGITSLRITLPDFPGFADDPDAVVDHLLMALARGLA